MVNEFTCPKCQSDNVQKISVIVQQGTSQINTQSSSAGVGVGIGGVAVGGGSTTTSGTAQNLFASQLAEDLKDESDFSLTNLIGFLVAAPLGIVVGSWVGGFLGWIAGFLAFGIAAVPFVKFDEYLDKTIFKHSSEAKAERQRKKVLWRESGYCCHRCSTKFIPGSDEVYNFSG